MTRTLLDRVSVGPEPRLFLRPGERAAMRTACVLALLLALAPRAHAATPAEADTFYAHKDWKRAASAYEALAKKEPLKARYQYRMGVSYGSLENWTKAIAAYRRADALGVPPMFARYNLACAYARAGMPDSALTTLEKAALSGPQ